MVQKNGKLQKLEFLLAINQASNLTYLDHIARVRGRYGFDFLDGVGNSDAKVGGQTALLRSQFWNTLNALNGEDFPRESFGISTDMCIGQDGSISEMWCFRATFGSDHRRISILE